MDKYPLNQAVIAQVQFDLRNGQLRRALEMGFTEEDLSLLKDAEKVSTLLNTPVSWLHVQVNLPVMQRLLSTIENLEQELGLIDQMLALEASSKMVADIFGLNQREVALRKRMLGLDKKSGRWQDLDGQQNILLWKDWKQKIEEYSLDRQDQMDMLKVCMILASHYHISMAIIWPAMNQWLEDEDQEELRKNETGCKEPETIAE